MRNAVVAMIVALITLAGCSSTQKTQGQGMVSVVAQNAVRIAGSEAVSKLDISEVYGRTAHVVVTGFADEFNRGYVLNLLRDAVEDAGGQLEAEGKAELTVQVAVNAAGNDLGGSNYIIGGSSRSEGSVNLTITVRNAETGARVSRQQIEGYAKYEQGTFFGITGSGAYFVLKGDDWVIVRDPAYY